MVTEWYHVVSRRYASYGVRKVSDGVKKKSGRCQIGSRWCFQEYVVKRLSNGNRKESDGVRTVSDGDMKV